MMRKIRKRHLLEGHKGGAPVKLTVERLDTAAEIARQEALPLAKIATRIAERFPDAPSFSLDRLSLKKTRRDTLS